MITETQNKLASDVGSLGLPGRVIIAPCPALFCLEDAMEMKVCTKCKGPKPKDTIHFFSGSRYKDGLRAQCKTCYQNTLKSWRGLHNQQCKATAQKWRDNNRVKWNETRKNWSASHPGYYTEGANRWRENNPEQAKAVHVKANNKRRSTPRGKLASCFGTAVGRSLKNNSKGARHWETLVGYTVDQLKQHLEKQFRPGMTWGNHGPCWHIDHIIPIDAFNFTCPEDLDFKRCWALKNLQPLGKIENIRKSAKLENPFQPSLCIAG